MTIDEAPDTQSKPARGRRPLAAVRGRAALLQAALDQFARRGYEGTSLRDLATQASVDVALVARLFGSKADLWAAVVDHLVERQVEHLETLRAAQRLFENDACAGVHALVALMGKISYEMPAFSALVTHELSNPGERMALLMHRLIEPFRNACRPVLLAAISEGLIQPSDPDVLFSMLISAIAIPMGTPELIRPGARLTPRLRNEIVACAMGLVEARATSQQQPGLRTASVGTSQRRSQVE